MEEFDVIVVGGGSDSSAIAARSAQHQHLRSGGQATDCGGARLPHATHHRGGAVTLLECGLLHRAHVGGGEDQGTLDLSHERFVSVGFTVTGRR